VAVSNTVIFSVTASGSQPLYYFWSRNNALIPGATNSSYVLYNAQLADSGSTFSCLVTNAYGTASGTNASLKVIQTVANGLCNGAIVITNSSYTNFQSTLKADAPGNPQPDCVDGFGHGVWYQFTTPADGLLEVDTFGSDFDTGLGFYTGSCGALTEVACNDDAASDGTSQIFLPTSANTPMLILTGGWGSDAGNLVFHLNYYTPPGFSVEPTNESVVVSSNAVFSPVLTGTQPMSFQWYFNNAPLTDGGGVSGSTNVTLTIANVQTNEGGNYQLVASNFVGVATSTVAVLTPVILPPSFVSPPVSQSVGTGSNVNFTAVMAGTPPFSFQWSLNGTPLADDGAHIAGSATASLTVTNLTTADAGSYSLTVTNVSGAVTASATLTVMVAPAITQQPVGRSVPPGLPTVFSAAVTGIPAPNYQWQFNGANIPGATSLNYTNPAVGTNDLGFYQLVASNLMGMVVSSNAQLTFGPVAAWGRNLNNECLPPPGLSNVISVAGAYQASFGVLANGTITAWGNTSLTNIPASATNVVALAGNGATAFAALRADGTVASWGGYDASSLSNIVSLALNSYFGYALRADGTVVNWGSANYPVPSGLNHVTAIAAGSTAALALRSDGTVTAWGSGAAMNVPAGLANVTAIAAGPSFDLALKADGTVAAWGTSSGTNLPAGLTNVVAISANGNAQTTVSCLAIRADGTVVAWGDTALAGGGMVFGVTNPPAALSNLHSVGVAAAAYHGLALVNFGAPQIVQPPVGLTASLGRSVTLHAAAVGAAPLSYQWLLNGSNVPGATNTSLVIPNLQAANAGNYQLFVSNTIATAISLPAPVTLVTNKSIVFLTQSGVSSTNVYQGGIGTFYGGAVQGNGPLTYQWYWSPTNRNYSAVAGGTNDLLLLNPALAVQSGYYYLAASNAAIGVTSAPVAMRVQFARAWGNYAVSNPPVNVTNAIALATGGYEDLYGQYLALGADGKVTAWANYPAIYGETNVSALSNYFVTAISAGMEDNLALKSDGTVYAWGLGTYGETNVPAGLNQVVAISCGGYHDLALTASGTVVGWGAAAPYNFGQATNNPAATNVVAISAGSSHSLALRADGTVVAWGNLIGGTVPLNATNIIAIAAGSGFSEALRANGTVLQWGSEINNYPVPLTMSNVVAISASGSHALALRNDGTVVSWGNEYLALASNNVPSDLTNVIAIASGTDHDFALLGNRAPAFTVQPWSRSIFNSASSVWFCGKCAGAQPITYQWQFNGTNLPAATNDTLTVNAAIDPRTQRLLPLSSGVYQLVASNAYGVTSSKYALLTVLIPLNAALNNSNVNWTTTGSGLWYGETNYTHDGVSAAQSGDIGVDQQSVLQATLVTNVSGNLTFWWEVSSEPYFDTLAFSVNGATVTNISGSVNWQQVSVPVTAGTNLLAWTYSKQSIYSAGLDAGWLDQVAFFAAPKILNQPSSVRANYGATVALSVFANGTTMLGYQWQQNGARVGGNSPTLTMNNVSRAQDGTYSVTVTNAGGAAVSSNVVVTVNVPQVLGAPVLLSNGSLQFTSADEGGGLLTASELSNFQAQVSTNLVNWVTLPNALSLTNGMLLLQDSAPTNVPARFYRIVEQ
jgi:alpha-tubulin suppressor-like RCC1 family protein